MSEPPIDQIRTIVRQTCANGGVVDATALVPLVQEVYSSSDFWNLTNIVLEEVALARGNASWDKTPRE